MAAQIAQLIVPSDAIGNPSYIIPDWSRGLIYFLNTAGVRTYVLALETQSPLRSVALSGITIYAVPGLDPVTGNLLIQGGFTGHDMRNTGPVFDLDPVTGAVGNWYGATSLFGDYPDALWAPERVVGVACAGVPYAIVKEDAFSGAVSVVRMSPANHAGYQAASLVTNGRNNRCFMCAAGASALLVDDSGGVSSFNLYEVTIAPGAETYDPATWPATNSYISSRTIGPIAAAAIDPAWTSVTTTGIAYDATDGNVIVGADGNAGTNRHYVAKINTATGAVLWAVPVTAANSSLSDYNVTRGRASFLPVGALDVIATDTGALTTSALAGLSGLGSVMSDDVSGLILLHGGYTAGAGAPVAVSGTPSSFTGWAILAPVVIIAPDYAITLDEDTSLSSAVVATGADGLVYTVLDAPAHGVLTLNADGTYTYDAARAWFGADGFTYRATDPASGVYDDGTVTITVTQAFPLTGVVKVLLPPAELQFCDANGVPYAGGTLEFYEPGTSNPKDTWSSPTGDSDTLNTNPLVLDAAGRALIYGDGAYRTVLRDAAGNLVWDQPSFTYVSACMVPVVGAADLATARQAMGVTDAIEAEAEARAAADSAEATARAAADTALGARIDAEIARAEAAEAALGARIDGLPAPAAASNVQGGETTFGADGHARITFPTPFATACTSIVAIAAAVGGWPVSINANTPDRFGVDVWGTIFGSRTPAAGNAFFWQALGD